MTIDAHHHFWKYDPQNYSWIDDDMKAIRKDFFPEDFLPFLKENAIDGTVLVQVNQHETETASYLEAAKNNSFIKGVVGWVDLQAANIKDRLDYWSSFPLLKGFRHIVQAEPDDNFMLQKQFCNGIGLLADAGFAYDILITPRQLPAALGLVKKFPNQLFVLDHIAKPLIKDGVLAPWKKNIMELAKAENVYCKVSGMVTEASYTNWKKEDFSPYLDVVTESFGTNRLLYGSDWPVCLVAGTYAQVKGLVKDYYSLFSDNEQKQIFGKNATVFYKL
jgi:L-fuconolactonase